MNIAAFKQISSDKYGICGNYVANKWEKILIIITYPIAVIHLSTIIDA